MFQPMDVGQIPTTQFNIPAPKPRGGMFGGGGGKALSVIAEALAAYSAGMGNPAGMAVLQGMNHRRQSKSDAELQEQQYQRQRMDSRDDWLWKQEHTPDQPTQTDRYLEEFLSPNTDPNRKAALGQILFPPVMGQVNGTSAIIDRAAMLGGGAPQQMQPGHVEDGFRFKGGNPGDPNAWEPVNGGPAAPPPAPFPLGFRR